MKRREFLERSIQTLVGGASATAALGQLGLVHAMAPPGEYRALVCVFLFGGNDSYNMLVPAGGLEYQAYARARQTLAVPAESLVPVAPLTAPGTFGFHPAASELADLFNLGKLAVVANVGALVEPATRDDVRNQRIELPAQLFSHNDQQYFWQSLQSSTLKPTGWAGRMADLLEGANGLTRLSMNVTLAGSNLWQTGVTTIPYSVGADGVQRLRGLSLDSRGQQRRRARAFHALLDAPPTSIFSQEFAAVQRRSIELADYLAGVLDEQPPLATEFPAGNRLASSLQTVAQLIAARQVLGMQRQTFFVSLGGWDTHGDQLGRHPALLGTLSQALEVFQRALEELGASELVTTFTASDFGRTLTSNGDGSDHGWGGHQLVMGGAVKGTDIYGTVPVIEIEGPQDSGQGRIIPTAAIDQMGATLASWFGLSAGELDDVFPNLRNFATPNLGFMR